MQMTFFLFVFRNNLPANRGIIAELSGFVEIKKHCGISLKCWSIDGPKKGFLQQFVLCILHEPGSCPLVRLDELDGAAGLMDTMESMVGDLDT